MNAISRVTKWIGVVAILGLTAAVCNNPTQSTDAAGGVKPSTGLTGTIRRGPVTPVCQTGVPCDAAYTGSFDVTRNGRRVATFHTDSTGRFSIALQPGSYTIVPSGPSPFMYPQPKAVTVQAQGMTEVQLMYDTGIR
jgi:hypothetical protein